MDFYDLFKKPEPRASNGHGQVRLPPGITSPWAEQALNDEVSVLLATPEGRRNHQLNTAAFNLGQIVAGGSLAEADVRDGLTMTARAIGLSEAEIHATIASGLKAGAASPRVPTAGPELPAVTVWDQGPTEETVTDFWDARAELMAIHGWARARLAAPWGVLGVVLARIIAATHHQIVLPPLVGGEASLNTFVGLVGSSGGGKGAAERAAVAALPIEGRFKLHRTGSGEGIAHAYMQRLKGGVIEQHTTNCLFSVNEVDTLAALGARQGATLMPELRQAWSGERLGFSYADPTKALPIPEHSYRLVLIVGIQPMRAGALLDDVDGGTPQRFLWLPATEPTAPDRQVSEPPVIRWRSPSFAMTQANGMHVMSVCAPAIAEVRATRLATLRGQVSGQEGHDLLCQLKVAAALAILDGRLDITDDDWDLSAVVAGISHAVRADVRETLSGAARQRNEARGKALAHQAIVIDEVKEERAVKRVIGRVLRLVNAAGPDGVSEGELRRKVAMRDRGQLVEALERAVKVDLISAHSVPGGTRYTAGPS